MAKNIFFFIIDDDGDDSEFFCEAVEQIYPTAKCAIAENGRDALDRLANSSIGEPDIIFLDLNMPLMDGRSCLRQLKGDARYKDIPVIIFTTSSSERDRSELMDMGAQDFLTKPISMKELCAQIEHTTEKFLTG